MKQIALATIGVLVFTGCSAKDVNHTDTVINSPETLPENVDLGTTFLARQPGFSDIGDDTYSDYPCLFYSTLQTLPESEKYSWNVVFYEQTINDGTTVPRFNYDGVTSGYKLISEEVTQSGEIKLYQPWFSNTRTIKLTKDVDEEASSKYGIISYIGDAQIIAPFIGNPLSFKGECVDRNGGLATVDVPSFPDKRPKLEAEVIDFSNEIISVSQDNFDWIKEAYDYGNVSTLTAAARKLTDIRNAIGGGKTVVVQNLSISDMIEYDKWVTTKFPDLIETELYPQ